MDGTQCTECCCWCPLLLLLQASANTLTAHIVSIFFLTFMIRKVTAAYQRVLEVSLRGGAWGGG
jgi:hypothetical protein